jgi:uncharacterized protein
MLEFEWDPEKDRSNLQKHGVSFLEAATVLEDPLSKTVLDPRHYEGECRYATTGYTSGRRFVVV